MAMVLSQSKVVIKHSIRGRRSPTATDNSSLILLWKDRSAVVGVVPAEYARGICPLGESRRT
jgi:hypothetical protein